MDSEICMLCIKNISYLTKIISFLWRNKHLYISKCKVYLYLLQPHPRPLLLHHPPLMQEDLPRPHPLTQRLSPWRERRGQSSQNPRRSMSLMRRPPRQRKSGWTLRFSVNASSECWQTSKFVRISSYSLQTVS